MIALYEKGERRVAVVEEARRWQQAGIVTAEQAAAVAERYRPELVRVNVFIRILLALFTTVGVVALVALPATMFDVKEVGLTVLCLFFAPLCAWVADCALIAGRRLYRCGAEEALLLLAVGMLALAVAIPAHSWGHSAERLAWLAAHGIVLAGAVLVTVRYGYALAAFGAMLALAGLPFHLADILHLQQPRLSRLVLLLLLGAAAIWAQLRLTGRKTLARGYIWSLETVRLAAWAGIYLDVNLFAHRLLWRQWLGWTPGEWQLPWSDPLCAVLTAILPVAALAMGIGRRDRPLLWFGIVSAILSIVTLKYYLHLGYLAEELTAAGLSLTGLAVGLLRWMRAGPKRCRGAFTAEPLLEPRLYGLNAEALAAIQPLTPAARVQQDGFQPGGGSFGGGGASGGY
ncbi:hypothetical protein [Geomonas anaerohicana]|uniref:DUF2157 domain-containing protein n=1 Tax=Geomonas anaerohicana TaxID=2798583 RepID=A0ABS0YGN6_9BACT|nr:hypothetical protein [Geomonas anaerohicana]MBJ6751496.1 hypothetical protein [Geomonas anaerohicana]